MTPGPSDALVEPGLYGWPPALDARLAYESDYEVLREVWNQYHGLLLARMDAATSATNATFWAEERSAAFDALTDADPRRNDEVRAQLMTWSQRVRELRGQA
ncbi:MAG: hypothetical protein ACFCVK_24815 [Acidimicrobiales bacterium]